MKISIVTVCFNDLINLKKTVKSLYNQIDQEFELIIVDGNSTDGTKEYLKKIERKNTLIISEKDKGIYDAMNKGIINSKGEYLFFLNSGDLFFDNQIILKIKKELSGDFIYGDILLEKNLEYKLKKQNIKNLKLYFWGNNINHQSIFIKKKVFLKEGLYNIDEKIYADFEHLFKSYKTKKYEWKYINYLISIYNLDGISSRENKIIKVIRRSKIILRMSSVSDKIIYLLMFPILKIWFARNLKRFNYEIK